MQIGFGLITCQRHPQDPRSYAEVYRDALGLASAAEDAGLDSVWSSEHHFWDDGYMPSLLVLSGAMAAATRRITIGTAVLLAPLYDPIRLAEDAATVELISGGRFVLGLGAGWRAEEFERLRIPMEAPGRRVSETVRILKAAWGPSTFSFEGKVFSYPATNVTPKPSGPIPILLGGSAPDAMRRAGRIADGYIGSSTRGLDFIDRFQFCIEGLKKAGRDRSDFQFAGHFPVWVTEDPATEARALELLYYSRWKYQDMGGEFGRATDGPLPAPPSLTDETRTSLRPALIFGSPEQVAGRIREIGEAAGDDFHFIARSYYPGLSQPETLEMVRLLGEVKKLL